jgi:hypothetical protein
MSDLEKTVDLSLPTVEITYAKWKELIAAKCELDMLRSDGHRAISASFLHELRSAREHAQDAWGVVRRVLRVLEDEGCLCRDERQERCVVCRAIDVARVDD